MKKTAVYIIVVVLLIFMLILSGTKLLGEIFGKKAEMYSLTAIGIILFVLLILNNLDRGNKNDKN
ncbi:MAG: hypothetical protein SOR72_02495 [Hornefia sp.]|nr:hypothetical protein [Hornefia sp.]